MPSSCDICWHQKCFSRSAEAMVLIIQLRSERRWVVNEKYTDSDLCKVSQRMTELTNSSQGAGKTRNRERERRREGRAAQRTPKELNVLSVWIFPLSCRTDADGVRKVAGGCWLACLLQKSQLRREKTSGRSSAQAPGELEQVERRRFDSGESVQEFL